MKDQNNLYCPNESLDALRLQAELRRRPRRDSPPSYKRPQRGS
jgi:hypothetical protein